MLLDSTFQVISMTTIVTAGTLTLKDVYPITHNNKKRPVFLALILLASTELKRDTI